jgi:hypothetical protein
MNTQPIFTPDDVIYAYTRKQALEDGVQVDANTGDFAEVTRQHYKYPVYMTRTIFDLVERAVENKHFWNDYKGVWHDILWMSRVYSRRIDEQTREFIVIIKGAGRKSKYTLVAQCGPMDIDDPQPVVTIMMPDEL